MIKRALHRIVAIAVVYFSASAMDLCAETNAPRQTFVQLGTTAGYGEITYEAYWDWVGYPGKSTLIYPLSTLVFPELTMGIRTGGISSPDLVLQLTGSIGFAKPFFQMEDHDYLYRPGYFEGEWSSTKSDVELREYRLITEISKRIMNWDNIGFSLYVSYRFQKTTQDIIGYKGTKLRDIWNGDFSVINVSSTAKAIYYEVTTNSVVAGPSVNFALTEFAALEMIFAYGYSKAKDYDNHLLRGKDIVGRVEGSCIYAAIQGSLLKHRDYKPSKVFFVARMDFYYAHLSGNQHQHFYADDPGTNDQNELGLMFDNPGQLHVLQAMIGIRVGREL